jgi:hypothetical protein
MEEDAKPATDGTGEQATTTSSSSKDEDMDLD